MVQPDWQKRSIVSRKAQEFWETFLERSRPAFRVPDEVTDPERREIFPGIPGSKTGHGSIALVLPNPFSNAPGVGGREIDRRRGENG